MIMYREGVYKHLSDFFLDIKGKSVDQLSFDCTVCYYWIQKTVQKAKHMFMHGGMEQVTKVSSMALMCYEMQ